MHGAQRALRVGLTGASSDLGRALLPRLQADARVERVIAFDVARPSEPVPKLEYVRVDLTRPGTEDDLRRELEEAKVDAFFHLAFVNSRVHGAAFAHELEVIGTMKVLAAAGAVRIARLVMPSLTVLYGARPNAPAMLREPHPLQGCLGSRFVTDRVEVESQVAAFAVANPETQVVVLRFAPLVGPGCDNPFTRMLGTRLIPTVLGFDPLWQVVHEDDAAEALHRALSCEARGAFNVGSKDVVPFSALVRLAGGQALPLPGPVLRSTSRLLESLGVASVPIPLLDYLTFSCVTDVTRAEQELGFVPRVGAAEALESLDSGGRPS